MNPGFSFVGVNTIVEAVDSGYRWTVYDWFIYNVFEIVVDFDMYRD